MFKTAGQFDGKILEIRFAEARFATNDDNAFDICLKIQGPDFEGRPQIDWWAGEMSRNYGVGNQANKTQAQITMENLRGIGFTGNDLTKLDEQLKGKTIPINVQEHTTKKGATIYIIKYIGGGDFEPKAIDPSSIAKRVAALTAAGPAPAPAPAQPETNDDLPW